MIEKKRAIAMGVFDGVHTGHAALLEMAKKRAEQIGGKPSVLSFDVHPDKLVRGVEVPLISNCKTRKDIIKRYFDIDDVVFLRFNKRTMQQPWQEFIDGIVKELNVGWLVVGHDFRCGYKGEGNTERLKQYCEENGIGIDVIAPVKREGITVSSTYIRELVQKGEAERAMEYMGHPYQISDTVRPGFKLGTRMGTPTINIYFEDGALIPKQGVYASKVYIEDGSEYIAATNVGVRPTVNDGDERISVESFLLDFSGDLYGKEVRVELYKFIRSEIKFENPTQLSKQIHKDAETIKEYFNKKADTLSQQSAGK